MFASDILEVFYAPQKVFKEIIQNPKYWGPILVFVIVIAAQSGFYYAQSEKIYYEQAYPAFPDQLANWTTNATIWTVSSGVTISNNFLDYINSSYYGNGSLQFAALSTNNISMAIPSFTSVDCSPLSFQNLSMRVKQVDPQSTPSTVTLTLYSQSNSNYFQYDLTGTFSNASLIGVWNNITVPVGPNAAGWQSTGSPQWTNVTGLKLEFSFASAANITLRMEGLFFRGEYKTASQIEGTAILFVAILPQVVFQYAFQWLFITAFIYIIIKGLKGTVTWKPIFIVLGLILIVTAVQGVLSLLATQALPIIHPPIEFQALVPGESDVINTALESQILTYSLITEVVALVTYAWIAALGAFAVHDLQPEFTKVKCVVVSVGAVIGAIVLINILSLFGI